MDLTLFKAIKSHHNVGGLPKRLNLKLSRTFTELFKDEVRELGNFFIFY